MAPKKQQQQQKGKGSKQSNAGAKDRAADAGASSKKNKGAAQVQISSENERKLRQLLQNTGNFQSGLPPGGKQHQQQQEELSVGQKRSAERRLRGIYETLLAEGFSSAQIEQALAALNVTGASLEAALDWLCMNLPANELPEKFSSGVTIEENSEGGSRSIQVLTVARPDWTPAAKPIIEREQDQSSAATVKPPPVVKEKKPEKVVQAEQAEWIKRYLADRDEESDSGSDGDGNGDSDWEMFSHPSEQHRRKEKRQVLDPHTRSLTIASEFQKAKEAAAHAKMIGDKEKQAAAGRLIRELRQEIANLGLSESILNQPSKSSFSGLGNSDFPSLGESHNTAFPSLGESHNTAFPSLGESKPKARPDAREAHQTAAPAEGHRIPVGVSFADLMKGGKAAVVETRRPEVSNMAKVSVTKSLPAWARPVEDDEPEIGGHSSGADEQEDETRAGTDLEDNSVDVVPENEPDTTRENLEQQTSARNTDNIRLDTDAASAQEMSTQDSGSHEGRKGATSEGENADEEDGMLSIFDEDKSVEQQLPETVVNMQKSSRITAWGTESSGNRQKKGALSKRSNQQTSQDELLRQPKALLQQQCQKNGWAPPRYEKLSSKGRTYAYTVTVTRPTVGRGKSKVIGGPTLCKLPEKDDYFETIADAQNAVATWALYMLSPELPLHEMIPDPCRTMYLRWQTSGQDARRDMKGQEDRRISFVDSLLKSTVTGDATPETTDISEQSETDTTVFEDQTRFTKHPTNDKTNARKEAESFDLKRRQDEKARNGDYKAMLKTRAALPMATVKNEFLRRVKESEVVVVSGETGCGKTTQVPQYILDEMISAGRGGSCNIICTQPRRIAAISVAERVAVERCESSPGSRGSLVGYQVRLDTAWNASTKLLFCTTGILLRRLGGDGDLDGVSHVVVDEVHERNVLGDFLLVILKDLLLRRRESGRPLKLILMSATLDSDLFSKYFGDCPVIKAKGRTFPVETDYLEDIHDLLNYRLASDSSAAMHNDYKQNKSKASRNLVDSSRGRQHLVHSGWGDDQSLEDIPQNPDYEPELYAHYSERTRRNLAMLNEDVIDYDLVEDLIIHIDENGEPGAILVFLPGMAEIQFMWDRLAVSKRFSGSASEWLLPLHSSVASADQKKVFQSPSHGVRKVVLATNIAETSITIDDVVHVIDSGKHKENRFNPRRGMSSMVEAWISQANAKQRSGRAGRVRPGNCYCLYTRQRFDRLRPFQLPEIVRVPLVELCLQIKLLKLGSIQSVLERALEPPKTDAILNAISTLQQVGALDEAEALTSLGYHLANLPVDVRVGKMMLFGAVLGCLNPILTIAACLSHKSPFTSPQDQREAAERARQMLVSDKGQDGNSANIASGQNSDHLAMVAAYDGWRKAGLKGAKAARDFCSSNFLSLSTLTMLRDMRSQFASLLADIGFIRDPQGDQFARRPGRLESLANDLQQSFNRNAHLPSVVKAALCAGLYPNVAAMTEESVQAGHASALSRRAGLASAERARWSDSRREVFVHPSSINHKVAEFRHPFVVFHEKVETSRVYLRDTTIISPYALLLFGGAISVQHQTGRVSVDGWLEMNSPAQTAVLFKNLRAALDSLLGEHIRAPQGTLSSNAREVISSIASLLVDEEKVPL